MDKLPRKYFEKYKNTPDRLTWIEGMCLAHDYEYLRVILNPATVNVKDVEKVCEYCFKHGDVEMLDYIIDLGYRISEAPSLGKGAINFEFLSKLVEHNINMKTNSYNMYEFMKYANRILFEIFWKIFYSKSFDDVFLYKLGHNNDVCDLIYYFITNRVPELSKQKHWNDYLRYLISKNKADVEDWNLIWGEMSSRRNYKPSIKVYLDAINCDKPDILYQLCTHYFPRKYQLSIVKYMLSKQKFYAWIISLPSFYMGKEDQYGNTYLHIAASYWNEEAYALFSQHIESKKNVEGESPEVIWNRKNK